MDHVSWFVAILLSRAQDQPLRPHALAARRKRVAVTVLTIAFGQQAAATGEAVREVKRSHPVAEVAVGGGAPDGCQRLLIHASYSASLDRPRQLVDIFGMG